MRKMFRRGLALAVVVSTVAGCQMPDPVFNESKWNFTGSNAANLAPMLDNPMDLVQGRSDNGTLGSSAAIPVMRLRRDQVKQLPNSDTTAGLAPSGNAGQSGSLPAELQ